MASSTSTLPINQLIEEKPLPTTMLPMNQLTEKPLSAISLDYDNCSDAGEEYAYRPLVFLNLGDINSLLIEKIKEINEKSTAPLILFSGSDRQTAEADRWKARVNDSAFTALREYQRHLATLNISSHIDPYLIGDTDEHKPAGSHFSKYFVYQNYFNPYYHKDEGKIRTLYAQMHRTAIKRPTRNIDFHFVNYRDDIIDILKLFFADPLYKPRNINLYIYKYDHKELSLKAFFPRDNSPTAPGSIDYNYQRTIQMIRPEYTKRYIKKDEILELTNTDDIKECILKHQNTISSKDRTYFADLIEAFPPAIDHEEKREEKTPAINDSQTIVDRLNDSSQHPLAKERLCSQFMHILAKELKATPVSSKLDLNTWSDLLFLTEHEHIPRIDPKIDLSAYITTLLNSKSPEKIAEALLLPDKSGWPRLNVIAASLPARLEEVIVAIATSPNGLDKIAESLLVKNAKGHSFQQLLLDAPTAMPLILKHIKLSPIAGRILGEALRLNDHSGHSGLHYILRLNSQLLPEILTVIESSPLGIDLIAQAFLYRGPTGCGLHDVIKYAPEHLPLLMSKLALHPQGAQFILQALTIDDGDKHSGKDVVKQHKPDIVKAFKQSLEKASPYDLEGFSAELKAAAARPATATYRALCTRSNPSFFSKKLAKTTLWKQLKSALDQEYERRRSALDTSFSKV